MLSIILTFGFNNAFLVAKLLLNYGFYLSIFKLGEGTNIFKRQFCILLFIILADISDQNKVYIQGYKLETLTSNYVAIQLSICIYQLKYLMTNKQSSNEIISPKFLFLFLFLLSFLRLLL